MENLREKFGGNFGEKIIPLIMRVLILSVFCTGFVSAAGSDMKGHDMAKYGRIGDLIHESVIDGYMLSYHFMDLRDQKTDGMDKAVMDKTHAMTNKDMAKPHHLMVYIMDKNHKPVLKGKVGFLFKDTEGTSQKAMGMYMSRGFGTTADMKKQGVYTITVKLILGDKKLMDKFDHEIK